MALPEFLSALRELILDSGPPAGSVEHRRLELAARFPSLASQEIDDLIAMPAERLAIYTDLVFAGQRGTLEWIFPATLSAIHHIEGLAAASPKAREYDFELTRDLHRHRTWRDSSTRSLARGFEDFLLNKRAKLVSRWPGLADLARLERIELEVFYALDEKHPRTRPEQVESLTQISVEDLMMLQMIRPGYAQIHQFAYDSLAIVGFLRQTGSLPDPLPAKRPIVAVCGRAIESLSPHWILLDPAQSATLAAAIPHLPTAVNALAEAYLATLPPDASRTDQIAFEQFFRCLATWLHAGVIMLCPVA